VALTLEQFFRMTPAYGFSWEGENCLTWPASWAMQRGYLDPAAGYRGRFSTRAAAMRFVRQAGGLVAVADAGAARAGLAEIDPEAALSGDIGVGRFDGARVLVGMIRAGAFWAALDVTGAVIIAEGEAVAAWGV
jgi:hypothetical protein